MDFAALENWMEQLLPAVEAAGRAILDVRAKGFDVVTKADASPVTAADQAAEHIVLEVVEKFSPVFPVVAEERVAAGHMPTCGEAFWLVDALDGTKEFIKGGSDFTVNVGFIQDGLPVMGLVHAPARHETYLGAISGGAHKAFVVRGGKRAAIAARPRPAKVVITGSKSHEVPELMDPFLATLDVAEKVVIGSSLKFCLVAEGKADLYPRFGPTSEWDTAAGHAVLRAAGGRVHDFHGAEIRYNKPKFLNGVFLADGGA
ncbi:MAG: 3'(2'),5'-bisphosphate nucleotidase CysQ [Rhodospirillaceae bacterium]|nr:3'(2'),5'-bisphosphate nucleotidase CysQ [Rhodospirillaceae bacterium]